MKRKEYGENMKAFLILEDGTVFTGKSIGADREVISEIVFNTSMTGYLEVLTDPSYAGQAVVMTYPLIGNYGICYEDMESERPWVDGFIVRELSRMPSNFRCEDTIQNFLEKNAGLQSRFANIIEFPDYTTDELMQIAKGMYKEQGYALDAGGEKELRAKLDAARAEKHFGNGRYVRNIFEKSLNNQALRLSRESNYTPESLTMTTK